jgi:hypothetical protein
MTQSPPSLPKVTIAILSWNRLHYLRATLESARRCIQYPNLEWIISDNDSNEPGLNTYLHSLKWIDQLLISRQPHAEAMNEIVEKAQGEFLLLWPDDVQFIIEGNWMSDLTEILQNNPNIGSITLDALRKVTLERLLKPVSWRDLPRMAQELYWYKSHYRRSHQVQSSRNFRMHICDGRHSGVCPSGIPSLTRTETWRRIGAWTRSSTGATNLIDSSMGAEDNMLERFYLSRLPLQSAIPWLPVAADIITDPLGCKAKIRGTRRYGIYMPPQSSDGFYYEIRRQESIQLLPNRPLSFMELAKPVGFTIPTDKQGDRLKFPINTSVIFDMQAQREIQYPLASPSD